MPRRESPNMSGRVRKTISILKFEKKLACKFTADILGGTDVPSFISILYPSNSHS